jgi:hypothetical protein
MDVSWNPQEFPNLNSSNFKKTSDKTRSYNCIGWALGDSNRWWWPDSFNVGFWPKRAKREEKLAAFAEAFQTLGYEKCVDGKLEPEYEKIALYAVPSPLGFWKPTHAALQLPDGEWTSKIGEFEDIRHKTLDGLSNSVYGTAVHFFKRPRVNP